MAEYKAGESACQRLRNVDTGGASVNLATAIPDRSTPTYAHAAPPAMRFSPSQYQGLFAILPLGFGPTDIG
ncbi:uncharacterized protein METZ01_LOCUS234678 [marine metagenome]|uniref:Uncharacterized protein n=1 Tax=marine metagenome TaxID=408172 RepID=A0A382H3J4_9ZZZZ